MCCWRLLYFSLPLLRKWRCCSTIASTTQKLASKLLLQRNIVHVLQNGLPCWIVIKQRWTIAIAQYSCKLYCVPHSLASNANRLNWNSQVNFSRRTISYHCWFTIPRQTQTEMPKPNKIKIIMWWRLSKARWSLAAWKENQTVMIDQFPELLFFKNCSVIGLVFFKPNLSAGLILYWALYFWEIIHALDYFTYLFIYLYIYIYIYI